MFMDAPESLIYIAVGAFFLGWVVAKIGEFFGSRAKSTSRDPKDDRIRSLEAELRVAKSDIDKYKSELEARDKQLAKEKTQVAAREASLNEQVEILATLRKDLRESVLKTRELRAELSERATENVKSEVKLREVETELSVAQASTDMIATGVLDYSTATDGDDQADGKPQIFKSNR